MRERIRPMCWWMQVSAASAWKTANDIGLTGRDIDAILITHEHIDHIAGLGVLSRRYGIPIYTTEKTADAIQETKSVGKIPEELFSSHLCRGSVYN